MHILAYIVVVGDDYEISFGETVFRLHGLEAFDSERKAVFPLQQNKVALQITVVDWPDLDGFGHELGDPKE